MPACGAAQADDQERGECERSGESEQKSDANLHRSLPDIRCGFPELRFCESDLLTEQIAGVVTEPF
jgi:hypothetical protein